MGGVIPDHFFQDTHFFLESWAFLRRGLMRTSTIAAPISCCTTGVYRVRLRAPGAYGRVRTDALDMTDLETLVALKRLWDKMPYHMPEMSHLDVRRD